MKTQVKTQVKTQAQPQASPGPRHRSHLAVLELLQADGAHGAGVGAAGRAPGSSLAMGARAVLGVVGFSLQAADGLPGLLVNRVLDAGARAEHVDRIHLVAPGRRMMGSRANVGIDS